ncbi:MAG: DUF4410 domain-containing protein [Xanthomonadaceae bacterium]|jgi:hypothetical protein|nr:DUF4410 domain-containing protein [Xanthomonadaceae bacterium]
MHPATPRLRLVVGVILVLSLAACGSTSKMQRSGDTAELDLSAYTTIVVADFANAPSKPPKADKRVAYDAEVDAARQRFARMLVDELRAYGVRGEIVRGEGLPGALLITGDITRYKEGNAALRLIVGFGAGSSYFDATVRFVDSDSGRVLGTITVDKNSWPLGGALAALQDGDSHMQGAAARIAEEVAIYQGVLKRGEKPAKGRKPSPTGCGRGGPGCDNDD